MDRCAGPLINHTHTFHSQVYAVLATNYVFCIFLGELAIDQAEDARAFLSLGCCSERKTEKKKKRNSKQVISTSHSSLTQVHALMIYCCLPKKLPKLERRFFSSRLICLINRVTLNAFKCKV